MAAQRLKNRKLATAHQHWNGFAGAGARTKRKMDLVLKRMSGGKKTAALLFWWNGMLVEKEQRRKVLTVITRLRNKALLAASNMWLYQTRKAKAERELLRKFMLKMANQRSSYGSVIIRIRSHMDSYIMLRMRIRDSENCCDRSARP